MADLYKPKIVNLQAAYECTDLAEFMQLVFPDEWAPIAARIIESGATFGETTKFAPRWSLIPFMKKRGRTQEEIWLKSIIFRVHDCIHQLWGLPVPKTFDEHDRSYFKRMWMCAEVAVLTITEFFYTDWLYETQPHCRELLRYRNTLLFKWTSDLRFKTKQQVAARLDELIHKQTIPAWVRDNEYGVIFRNDYVKMLAQDRVNIDHNWMLLRQQKDKQYLDVLPNQRYSSRLDGLEMTLGMISDFEHILSFTGQDVDVKLAEFNRQRRLHVNLPDTWNEPPQ